MLVASPFINGLCKRAREGAERLKGHAAHAENTRRTAGPRRGEFGYAHALWYNPPYLIAVGCKERIWRSWA